MNDIRIEKKYASPETITRMILPQTAAFEFEFDYRCSEIEAYYLDAKQMDRYGIDFESLVVIEPVMNITDGMTLIALHDNKFYIGEARRDFFEGCEFYNMPNPDDPAFPIILDAETVIGKPVGVTEYTGQAESVYKFKELKI